MCFRILMFSLPILQEIFLPQHHHHTQPGTNLLPLVLVTLIARAANFSSLNFLVTGFSIAGS